VVKEKKETFRRGWEGFFIVSGPKVGAKGPNGKYKV
jgi:hypothetical protein